MRLEHAVNEYTRVVEGDTGEDGAIFIQQKLGGRWSFMLGNTIVIEGPEVPALISVLQEICQYTASDSPAFPPEKKGEQYEQLQLFDTTPYET